MTMAYVRYKTIGGNRYAYLQESYRDGGKVRTRHIRYIGGSGGGGSSGGSSFAGACDRLRRTPEGEKFWQDMMKNKQEISEAEFLKNVNIKDVLDEGETWEVYKQGASDEIKFYKSNDTHFFQTAGFEFIWRKGSASCGGSLGTTGGAEYKPGTDPVKTLIKQDHKKMDAAIAAGKESISAEDHAKLAKHRGLKHDTKDKFFDERTGMYTPKRHAMHNRMIQKIDNPNAMPKKGHKPKAIFIGGLSASGKTKAVGGLLDRIPGKPDHEAYPKYVYINSDDFKRWLPEYNGYNATFVHEESSEIFDRALKVYRAQGKQVIIDATMKTAPKARDKMAAFKKAGYKTVLLGTNIPGEKAIERATKRFNRSKRYVPLEFIKKAAKPTSKSVLKLRHRADDYKVFNTNVPKGAKPKLIESKRGLKLDRKQDAKFIVKSEKVWRKIGTDRADLKGYDTKKHKKVRVRI